MTRGYYSSPVIATDTRYHAGFIQDSWTFGRITFKPGLRFEQQSLIGNTEGHTFAHNWAPRLGVIVDPFNDRKTKIFASIGPLLSKKFRWISPSATCRLRPGVTGAFYADPGAGNQPNLSPSNYVPRRQVSRSRAAGGC